MKSPISAQGDAVIDGHVVLMAELMLVRVRGCGVEKVSLPTNPTMESEGRLSVSI